VLATLAFVALACVGWRAMRRDAPQLALSLATLLLCGTRGVAAYLNLKAGASLGRGLIPDSAPHEARERDYFFVLGFWAWGCFAGYGATAIARARRWPAWTALAALLLPLAGNWRTSDRSRASDATAAHRFAIALLASAPARAVLFVAGDNDSYPLWYAQQAEGVRRDVQLVTLPLLPASWYGQEIARRTGLRWRDADAATAALLPHERTAAGIARAARAAGRPIAASPALSARERTLLGGGWTLRGPVYVSALERDTASADRIPRIDTGLARSWVGQLPPPAREGPTPTDDVVATMLTLLDCPRLALPWTGPTDRRDSLEVKCNLR
jgi:hypothetical protein